MLTRFIGAPRAMVAAQIGESAGWRELGERMKERAVELCPVGEEGENYQGPHLKDTLELKVITGGDPRLLIGSTRKGDVLAYVVQGTQPHPIDPVNAKVLRFTSGGTTVFAAHVDHPGHPEPNNFVLLAIREVTSSAPGGG